MKILVRNVLFPVPGMASLLPLLKAKSFRGHKRVGGKGSPHKGSHWDEGGDEDAEWDDKVKNQRQEFVVENASIAPPPSASVRTRLSAEELQERLEAEPYRKPKFWNDLLAGHIVPLELPETLAQPDEENRSVEGIRKIWDSEIVGDAPFPGRRVQTPVGDVILRPDNFEHPFTKVSPVNGETVLRSDRVRFIRFLVPTLQNPLEVWADDEGASFLAAYRRSNGKARQIVVVTVPYGQNKQLKTMMAADNVNTQRKEGVLLWAKWREGKIEKAGLGMGRHRMVLAQSRVSLGQLRPTRDSAPNLIPLISSPTNDISRSGVPLLKAIVVGGGEDCPNCGAAMERGDDGKCNRCHKPWPATTLAEIHPDADGGYKGACPHCNATQFSDSPPESRNCSECKKPFDVERIEGSEDLHFIPKVGGKRVGLPPRHVIKGHIFIGEDLSKTLVSGHYITTHGGKQVWIEPYQDSRIQHERPKNEQKPRAGDSGVLFPEIGFVRPLKDPKANESKPTGLEGQLSLFEKAHASGFALQGRRSFRGFDVSIENRKGSWRVDKAHTPPKWKTKMVCDYGYLKGTQGVDGDHLDVFVGQSENAANVYIVRQLNPRNGAFDEQKFMLGFDSLKEAKAMYLRHYDTPKFFGGIKAMPFETFKRKALATLERTRAQGNQGGLIKAAPTFEEVAHRNRRAIDDVWEKNGPKTIEQENAYIERNKQRVEAHIPHPFMKATWTAGNGHPRCVLCGDEEPEGGRCDGLGGLPDDHWAAKVQKKRLAQNDESTVVNGRVIVKAGIVLRSRN